jgi:RNA polymerase sigma factor (sigma-70 family)
LEDQEPVNSAARPGTRQPSQRLHRAARAGDPGALEEFFRRQLPLLKRWADVRVPRWLAREADADDFVQRTALRTLQRLGHLPTRSIDEVQAYMRQILVNLVRDEIRRAGRRPDHVAVREEDAIWERSPLDTLVGRHAWSSFTRALKSLSPRDRAAIVGRFEAGLSYRALQLRLNTETDDAARIAVSRAVSRLAAAMHEAPAVRARRGNRNASATHKPGR